MGQKSWVMGQKLNQHPLAWDPPRTLAGNQEPQNTPWGITRSRLRTRKLRTQLATEQFDLRPARLLVVVGCETDRLSQQPAKLVRCRLPVGDIRMVLHPEPNRFIADQPGGESLLRPCRRTCRIAKMLWSIFGDLAAVSAVDPPPPIR